MAVRSATLSPRAATVLRLIAAGYTYEQIVARHRELSYLDIFEAAREALDATGAEIADEDRQVADEPAPPPRIYRPWDAELEARLVALVRSGESIERMADLLGQEPMGVFNRMRKLGLAEADERRAREAKSEQVRRARVAIELLRSWSDAEGEDAEEQRETGELLMRALDDDRLSYRKLFPER